MLDDDRHWFEPKRYGYGAGLPVAWQGWVLLGLFVGGLAGAGLLFMPDDPVSFFAVTLVLTGILLFVASRKTRGGWRWRSGEKD